ncbi:unnamed protein product [Lota lota]
MEEVMERECSALGGLFQTLIGDMKSSSPVWEDFISKAGKLQSQLRTTVVTVAAFLDAFQKVADLATNSRGGTREIGGALSRMCMRQRSIETKLRHFSMVFLDCLILPLQDQMEDWKRNTHTLDKDHAKEYKKVRQEIKKRSSDTARLQKKAKKGRGDIQPQLDSAMQDVSDKYFLLEETEKQALRRALVEERSRFCSFASMLRPVVEEEILILGEMGSLRALNDDIRTLTMDPHKLPPSSEQVIVDLKGSEVTWSYQTPPSSPSTSLSRKSSMCRPAPYELRRTKTTDPSSHLACDVTKSGEEPARARVGGSVTRSKVGHVQKPQSGDGEQDNGSVVQQDNGSVVQQDNGSVVQQDNGSVVQQDNGSVVQQDNGSVVQQDNGSVVQQDNGSVVQQDNGSVVQQDNGSVVQQDNGSVVQQDNGSVVQQDSGSVV